MIASINLSVEEFMKIISVHELVLVDFYADWCEPCKLLDEILLELEPRIKEYAAIEKLDIDQHLQLQTHFTIRSVPTLMIFKRGELVWRMSGFMLTHEMEALIKGYKAES